MIRKTVILPNALILLGYANKIKTVLHRLRLWLRNTCRTLRISLKSSLKLLMLTSSRLTAVKLPSARKWNISAAVHPQMLTSRTAFLTLKEPARLKTFFTSNTSILALRLNTQLARTSLTKKHTWSALLRNSLTAAQPETVSQLMNWQKLWHAHTEESRQGSGKNNFNLY